MLSVKLPLYPQLKIDLSQQFSWNSFGKSLPVGWTWRLPRSRRSPNASRRSKCRVAFYIAMSEEDELAYEDSVTLDMLAGRAWVIFERRMHPPVYDSDATGNERKITPAKVHHFVVPEDAYPFIVDGESVAFVVKSGAIRIARDGITVRPLAEDALMLKTYLASRADEKSKVVSELVRAFMRKLSTFTNVRPFPVRLPVCVLDNDLCLIWLVPYRQFESQPALTSRI